MRRVWMLMTVGALALGGASCKQGDGERCQIDSDCSDGLICCERRDKTKICLTKANCSITDTGVPDASVDGGSDMTRVDLFSPDKAGPDMSKVDAAADAKGDSKVVDAAPKTE